MSSEDQWSRAEVLAYNAGIIDSFRASGGRPASYPDGSVLLLTTRGARSGLARTSPVSFSWDGSRIVVIGSNAGSPRHPDWYFNVLACAEVTVELPGDESFEGRATVVAGDERDRLLAAQTDRLATARSRTTREFPVVVIERR